MWHRAALALFQPLPRCLMKHDSLLSCENRTFFFSQQNFYNHICVHSCTKLYEPVFLVSYYLQNKTFSSDKSSVSKCLPVLFERYVYAHMLLQRWRSFHIKITCTTSCPVHCCRVHPVEKTVPHRCPLTEYTPTTSSKKYFFHKSCVYTYYMMYF